ncbi:glycoprotein A33 (transmembrane), paralog a [Megalobrama amblycephala]|uniref:glycoprotein A33 (transmembrane), paralog a n=1 Tax=Megalobrama amblycephala TaxID=75352 RepID=UPI002014829B|nr:glycoprotein A33 (transmembrane), paralog a [Megalobrama amblycephala]
MAAILGIFGICLLFSGVQETSSVMTVDIPQAIYKIALDDNVTIPCKFTPQTDGANIRVTWTATPDVTTDPAIKIVTYSGPTSIKVYPKYKGRAILVHDIKNGKADLQLLRVTSADTRFHACEVENTDNEEDAVSDRTNLIVLVPPSPPICKIEGVSEYYQNINLTCRSEKGSPPPTYKWQRYDTNNIAQLNPPKATDLNGVLSLYNITKETSGFFICTSTNEIRSEKCNLTLAVMPPSMSMASVGGIVGAVVAVALIFGLIIICCYCCRKKEKAEEYRMGTPEGGEFTDKDPEGKVDGPDEHVSYEEERRVKSAGRHDPQDDRSERSYDRRSDYTDRRDDPSDRRERYDRDDRYDDRRDRYDDRRDRHSDRNDRYDDRRDRYDDRRDRDDDSDHYSERYDSRDRPPSVPPNKPNKPKDPRY